MKSTSGFSLSKLTLYVLLGLAIPYSSVYAASGSTYTWTGGASTTDWNTTGNWSSSTGSYPGLANVSPGNDVAQFNSASGSAVVTLSANVTGSPGTQINLVSGETGNVSINAATTSLSLRTAGISIASGDGALTLGATSGTTDAWTLALGTTGQVTYNFTNSSSSLATYGTNVTINTGGSNALETLVFNGSGNSLVSGKITNGSTGEIALTQSGSSTLTLSGSNSYNGGTLISGGMVIAANNAALGFGGRQFINTSKGTTVNGAAAAATLDLTGATTVNQVITLNGGANGANLIVNSGATTLSNGVAEVDFSNGGTGFTNNATLALVFNNSGTNETTSATGSVTTANTGSVVLFTTLATAGAGYTSAPQVSVTTGGGSNFTGTAVLSSLTLTGTNNNIGGAGGLNLVAALGNGTSAGGFTKIGSGTVTLSGSNTYSGGTTVNAGVLTVNGNAGLGATTGSLAVNNTNTGAGTAVVVNLSTTAATTVGSLSGSIATPSSGVNTATINNGGTGNTFTVNQTSTGTYSGVIAGSGGFTLGSLSTNTLTVTGANTYSGGTTVNAGTLMVNNASGTSGTGVGSVTVNSGGTLAGSGFIKPTLTGGVNVSGGTLTPGGVQPTVPFTGTAGKTAAGNLTLDTTGLTSGTTILNVTSANLTFALGAGNATSGSQIVVTGPSGIAVNNTIAFSLSSPSTVTINDLVGANLTLNQEYVLIDGNNTMYTGLSYGATTALGKEITGGLTLLPSDTSGNFFSQWYNSSQLYLVGDNIVVDVVPEPGTWAMMLAGLLGLVVWQRRKNQKS